MDMLAHIRHLGNHAQRLVAHVLGMRGGEADAHRGCLLGHTAQQLREKYLLFTRPLSLSKGSTIRIHILSQQSYLLIALVAQIAYLGEDTLDVTTALTASGIGHDAVMTEVVTASHDAHETADLMSQSDTLGHHVAISLCGGQFDVHRLMAQFCLCHEVRQREVGIGTCHEVTMMVIQQILLCPFCHTT